VLPDGTPNDERTIVVADATGIAAFDQHAVNVGSDGRFRVAFAADATRGHLRLNGHYVFLEPSAIWSASDATDPVVLRMGGHWTLEEEGSIASPELAGCCGDDPDRVLGTGQSAPYTSLNKPLLARRAATHVSHPPLAAVSTTVRHRLGRAGCGSGAPERADGGRGCRVEVLARLGPG
jgi:hypothetical protein